MAGQRQHLGPTVLGVRQHVLSLRGGSGKGGEHDDRSIVQRHRARRHHLGRLHEERRERARALEQLRRREHQHAGSTRAKEVQVLGAVVQQRPDGLPNGL
jgi:hypothetical protein